MIMHHSGRTVAVQSSHWCQRYVWHTASAFISLARSLCKVVAALYGCMQPCMDACSLFRGFWRSGKVMPHLLKQCLWGRQ